MSVRNLLFFFSGCVLLLLASSAKAQSNLENILSTTGIEYRKSLIEARYAITTIAKDSCFKFTSLLLDTITAIEYKVQIDDSTRISLCHLSGTLMSIPSGFRLTHNMMRNIYELNNTKPFCILSIDRDEVNHEDVITVSYSMWLDDTTDPRVFIRLLERFLFYAKIEKAELYPYFQEEEE